MLKKISLLVLCLLLVACADKQPEQEPIDDPVIEESIFIEPIRDVFLFDELDAKIRQDWLDIIRESTTASNYHLEMMFTDIYDGDVDDIYGNTVNLSDYKQLVFCFISTDCPHCKKEIDTYLTDIVNEYADVQFVLYFGKGDVDEIKELFNSLGVGMPDNAIIISENNELFNYVKYDLAALMYPTFVFFKNGKVSFDMDGELSLEQYRKAYDFAFVNTLNETDFINEDGINIFDLNRTVDDVKNSLSKQNQERIDYLDDKIYTYTSYLTYRMMGDKLDFSRMLEGSSQYISEINNYYPYQDSELVLFYVALSDKDDVESVEFINSLMSDKSKEYIVVFYEGFDSSSHIYQQMDVKFNCPVVSILGYMPKDFYKYAVSDYPSAIFVNKGTFTGAYSVIEDADKFAYALDTFLGENCIALKANN